MYLILMKDRVEMSGSILLYEWTQYILNEMRIRWVSTVSALWSVSVSCNLLAQAWSLAELGPQTVRGLKWHNGLTVVFTWLWVGRTESVLLWFVSFPQSAWQGWFFSPTSATFGLHHLPLWNIIKGGLCVCLWGQSTTNACALFQSYAQNDVTPSGDWHIVRCHNIGSKRMQRSCRFSIFSINSLINYEICLQMWMVRKSITW